MGDPAGIGPEIILAMLAGKESRVDCQIVVIGSAIVLDEAARLVKMANPCTTISEMQEISASQKMPFLLDLKNIRAGDYLPGVLSPQAGSASVEYVLKGIDLALRGDIDALVTGPIHKEAIHLAGYRYQGHTELLAEKTGVQDYAMMLMGGPIRVILVTTHLALREVPGALNKDAIYSKITLANSAMVDLGFERPRIAVAGLNPHGGEGGLFGDEEKRIISPAVSRAQRAGINASGPLPPDTVFYQAYRKRFDAVVCMYHDQGLIPLKMIAFEKGVNVTLGLPIVRTSVDHGTAFDIAGKGLASPESLIEAVKIAIQLVRKRRAGNQR
jgi:4-hydroxythreonine-4-phosphate dehydrogenase